MRGKRLRKMGLRCSEEVREIESFPKILNIIIICFIKKKNNLLMWLLAWKWVKAI